MGVRIRAGDLDRIISIQAKAAPSDPDGYQTGAWTNVFANVPARIITTGGGEFYAAQRVNAATTAVIEIRYRAGITAAHRITYGSRIFEILGVNDVDEKRVKLQVAVREVV